jgi:hypothetical protein
VGSKTFRIKEDSRRVLPTTPIEAKFVVRSSSLFHIDIAYIYEYISINRRVRICIFLWFAVNKT